MISGNNSPLLQESPPYHHTPTHLPTDCLPMTQSVSLVLPSPFSLLPSPSPLPLKPQQLHFSFATFQAVIGLVLNILLSTTSTSTLHTSHRENSGAAEGEKYLKILEDYNFKLEKRMIEMNENLEALTSQLKKKK